MSVSRSSTIRAASFVLLLAATTWVQCATGPLVQLAELTASTGQSGDKLGYSIAVSGDTVVVGAPGVTPGFNYGQGAAYVFVKPASGWANMIPTAVLMASD